jgi:hypothetical protein
LEVKAIAEVVDQYRSLSGATRGDASDAVRRLEQELLLIDDRLCGQVAQRLVPSAVQAVVEASLGSSLNRPGFAGGSAANPGRFKTLSVVRSLGHLMKRFRTGSCVVARE